MTIENFFSQEEISFWNSFCEYTCNNKSNVSLVTGDKANRVERKYYTLLNKYKFMEEVKHIAEKNFEEKLFYQPVTYGYIMHYDKPGVGLKWHSEPNISAVSVSINISKDEEYEGAELQFKNKKVRLAYNTAVFYRGDVLHRVTPLISGEKKSIVMWLPNKEKLCADS